MTFVFFLYMMQLVSQPCVVTQPIFSVVLSFTMVTSVVCRVIAKKYSFTSLTTGVNGGDSYHDYSGHPSTRNGQLMETSGIICLLQQEPFQKGSV